MAQKSSAGLTKADLLARGWTDAIVKRLLGAPDQVLKLGGGRVAHIYSAARVELSEATEAFKTLAAKAAVRAAAGRAVAKDREAKLAAYVETVSINVERCSIKEVDQIIAATKGATKALTRPEVWNRWRVNALRHDATQYDDLLKEIEGNPGVGAAYVILKRRVLAEIARLYPFLAQEVERQRGAAQGSP